MTVFQKTMQFISLASFSLFLMLSNLSAKAQITITTVQQLNFGAFCPGNAGGTITISPTGIRTTTGDIITINPGSSLYIQAIFEVEAPIGSRIIIVASDAHLTDGKGRIIVFHMNGSEPASPFITTMARTNISIGGTLTVGKIAVNPSGKYSGSSVINFILE